MNVEQNARYCMFVRSNALPNEPAEKNSSLQERLEVLGFTDVTIWGAGRIRLARAVWPGLPRVIELPSYVEGVKKESPP